MEEDYVIVEHETGEGRSILVLRPKGSAQDFLLKLKKGKGDRGRYQEIVQVADRIDSKGEDVYRSKIRTLDASLSLIEIKVDRKVIRVMAHMHLIDGRRRPILLFDFDGHQGSNRIPPHIMNRARKLASIAGRCAEQ